MGLRAAESSARAKREEFVRVDSKCNSKRTWHEWLPIFSWSTEQVFNFIHANGQEAHWAYAAGMTRLSCAFCIMSSERDLLTAATLNPELYRKYVEMENKIDHTFIMPKKNMDRRFLDEVIPSLAKKFSTIKNQ